MGRPQRGGVLSRRAGVKAKPDFAQAPPANEPAGKLEAFAGVRPRYPYVRAL